MKNYCFADTKRSLDYNSLNFNNFRIY